ncbi:MAG: MFS transporter [Bacteroidales bacterium]|nr:MFS transporter [Bacteroidales bacterium]
MTRKSKNTAAIIIMFLLFAMMSFVSGLQNPMGIIAKAQFGASNAISQLGVFMNFFAYLIFGIPAGVILKKRGYKITSLEAVALGLVGVTITFLSGVFGNYWVYLLGALISGFALCMLNTLVQPMLNTLGGGGNRGNQLVQFGGSCNSMAAALVPMLCGYLIGEVTADTQIKDVNVVLYIAMGIFALAFLIIFISYIPEPELEAAKAAAAAGEKEEEGMLVGIRKTLGFRNLVFGMIGIFVYVGAEVGISNIANLYMATPIEQGGLGILVGVAGTLCGVYWLLMLVGRILGGMVGGKVSSRSMLSVMGAVAIALLIVAIFLPKTITVTLLAQQVPVSIILMILCGLCTSVMSGAIFNMAVEGLGQYTSLASGLINTMCVGGGVLLIALGAISDKWGFVSSFWLIILCFIYLIWYALRGSRPNKKLAV